MTRPRNTTSSSIFAKLCLFQPKISELYKSMAMRQNLTFSIFNENEIFAEICFGYQSL